MENPMNAFARWTALSAATFAALLAVVWILEARPMSGQPLRDTVAACEQQVRLRELDALARRDTAAAAAANARRADCAAIGAVWNEAGALRGLLAGLAAVVLLVLSTLVPAGAPRATPRREGNPSLAEIEAEQRRTLAEEGRTITAASARARVEARARGEHV
jgi:hypothetical protein